MTVPSVCWLIQVRMITWQDQEPLNILATKLEHVSTIVSLDMPLNVSGVGKESQQARKAMTVDVPVDWPK